MGFGSWLKGATRIRFDSHTLGNLARNGGLAAGALIGGPAGAALAGGISAARTAARPGANFGDILKSGVGDASTAYGLNKAGGLAKGALTRGAGGAAPIATGGGGLGAAPPPVGGLAPISAGAGAPTAITGANVGMGGTAASRLASPGVLGGAARGLRSAGSFVGDHPEAVGMGLKGLGSIATSGTENRMNEAEIAALEQGTSLKAEEAERKRMQDIQMEPIRQALMLQLARGMGGAQTPASPNPYALPLAGG